MPSKTFAVGLLLALALVACEEKKTERATRALKEPAVKPRPPGPARPKPAKPKPIKPKSIKPGPLLPPEKAPHPDYPTERLARTDKIFLLEEPDRGPVVTEAPAALAAKLKNLRWVTYAHCEVEHGRVACGSPVKAGVRRYHRVGRRGGKVVVVERRFGPRVERTIVFDYTSGMPGNIARIVELDERRNVSSSAHFDGAGARYSARRLDGGNALDGCGFLQLTLDKRRRVSRVSCLQWSSAPMRDTRGVATQAHTRDRRGLVVASRNLDEQGRPVDDTHGVHRVQLARDAIGRVTTRRFFDSQGFPTLSSDDGCYGWRYAHDARGLIVSQSCLDAEGKALGDENGVCRYESRFDGRGCRVGTARFRRSKAGRCDALYRQRAHEVDASCALLKTRCLDAAKKATACHRKAAAERRYTVDARGYRTSTKYFDPAGQPGSADCGAFEERVRRDARGNVIHRSYFGEAGEPMDCAAAGYHGVTYRHDDAGRTLESRFLDRRGQPGTNLGCAIRRFRYDNYDHQAEAINYDAKGAVVEVLGLARRKTIYDPAHRVFGILLYDKAGKPARYRGCFVGRSCPRGAWHAVRIVRRQNGAVSGNQFFDAAGQLIKTLDCGKSRCWR